MGKKRKFREKNPLLCLAVSQENQGGHKVSNSVRGLDK